MKLLAASTLRIRDLFAYPLPGDRLSTPLGPATMRGPRTDPHGGLASIYHVYLDASPKTVTAVAAADVIPLIEL